MLKTIAIIIVLFAANLLMVISIRKSAIRVDYSLRRHFALKLTNEELLDEMKTEEETEIREVFSDEKNVSCQRGFALIASSSVAHNAQYLNKNISEDYKLIKTVSKYTPEYALKCAKELIKKENYSIDNKMEYKNILDKLSFDTICELSTLPSETQVKVLIDYLGEKGQRVIDEFNNEKNKDFNSIEFYEYLKELSLIYCSGYSVVTGDASLENKQTKDGVNITVDNSICEGSKVIYGNRVYDYSI